MNKRTVFYINARNQVLAGTDSCSAPREVRYWCHEGDTEWTPLERAVKAPSCSLQAGNEFQVRFPLIPPT